MFSIHFIHHVKSIIKEIRQQNTAVLFPVLQTTLKSVTQLEMEKIVLIIFFAVSRTPPPTVPGPRTLAVLNLTADIATKMKLILS